MTVDNFVDASFLAAAHMCGQVIDQLTYMTLDCDFSGASAYPDSHFSLTFEKRLGQKVVDEVVCDKTAVDRNDVT
jgi:hypothetical protein